MSNRYINDDLYQQIETKTIELIPELGIVITPSQMLDTIIKAGIDLVTAENYMQIRDKAAAKQT